MATLFSLSTYNNYTRMYFILTNLKTSRFLFSIGTYEEFPVSSSYLEEVKVVLK